MRRHVFIGACIFAVGAVIAPGESAYAAGRQSTIEVQIVANDMCCKGCAQKVAAQLYAAPGVKSVAADVPNRIVTITAVPTPKLTAERLWLAVEKGKGGPSKLITPTVTYVLFPHASLPPEQQLPAGRYLVKLQELHNQDAAQQIANCLHTIQGVQDVQVNSDDGTLTVQASAGAFLSPWMLATIAEQASATPVAIAGPYGVLTIERHAGRESDTATKPRYSQTQGDLR